MAMLKIEMDNKIFKIPRPRSFDELQAKLQSKFGKHEMYKRAIYYKDCEGDDVLVENDGDIEVAMLPDSGCGRLVIKATAEELEDTSNALKTEDLGRMFRYLESLVEPEKLKKVEECLSVGKLPCPRCLCDQKIQDEGIHKRCRACCGRGQKPMTKIWSLVLFLIDCKVKELLLNPISDLVTDRSSSSLKDHLAEKNSTKISYHLTTHRVLEGNLEHRSPPDLFNKSDVWSNKQPADDLKSKVNDSSILDQSFNPKSFKKQNTFIGPSSVNFGGYAKEVNLSFPDYGRIDQKKQEDERFFTKEQLHYGVMEAQAWLANANTVEVRLLIEGMNQKDWPAGVRIRGKDCDMTKGVDIAMEKRLRQSSIVGIKFNFSVKSDLTERVKTEPLCFEFVATDLVRNIKYFSRPLKIQLNLKKNSKVNVCSLVR
jgi:hypothetical protein